MSPPPNTKQGEATRLNDLPPYLYWICTSVACATLLPAVYVACLMFESGILSPTVRYLRDVITNFQDPGARREKVKEEAIAIAKAEDRHGMQNEDVAIGFNAEEKLWKVEECEGKGEGIPRTRLTRTRRA